MTYSFNTFHIEEWLCCSRTEMTYPVARGINKELISANEQSSITSRRYIGYKTKTRANEIMFWTTGVYQRPSHFRGLLELHGPRLRGSQWSRPYSCENNSNVTTSIQLSRWPRERVYRLTRGCSDASQYRQHGIRHLRWPLG